MDEASGPAEVSTPTKDAQFASTDEADNPDSTPGSPTGVLAPFVDYLNRWGIDKQYQVCLDAKFLNDKGVMTWTFTLERWVFTGSLPTMPNIHALITRHRLEWTTRSKGHYTEELV